MKLNFETIGNTMLNIISSTVVVLPFMIFLESVKYGELSN
ncbi:hypothetical protein LAPL110952_12670 [Lactiplantibacillus plajomi]|jgi:hypothetical protein